MLETGEQLDTIMDEVDVEFGADEGALLRFNLVAAPDEATPATNQIAEEVRLRFLASRGTDTDTPTDELVGRARALQREARLKARFLASDLLGVDLNERSRAILAGLASAWTLDDIVELERESPGAAASILHQCPTFAGNPDLWSAFPRQASDLVEALVTAPTLTGADAEDVLRRLLPHGVGTLPDGLIRSGGALFARALLVAAGEPLLSSRSEVPAAWVRGVGRQVDTALAWMLKQHEPLTGLQAWVLAAAFVDAPDAFTSIDERQWTQLLEGGDGFDEWLAPQVSAFLFGVADEFEGRIPLRLLELSVPTLHSLLVDAALAPELWDELGRRLPRPREWKGWDNAERMRRWVFARIEGGSMFIGDLPKVSQEPESFQMLLATAVETKQGRRVLKELGVAVSEGSAKVSEAQRTLLDDAISRAQERSEEKKAKKRNKKRKRRRAWWEWWL